MFPPVVPSELPGAAYPALTEFLRRQVDMQIADLRLLFRLPVEELDPHVGCNLTTAAMMLNVISGFSVWFFQTDARARRKRAESFGRHRCQAGPRRMVLEPPRFVGDAGNAGSNTASDHIAVLDEALAQLPEEAITPGLLVRCDRAGATHAFLDHVVARGLRFSVGLDLTEPVRQAMSPSEKCRCSWYPSW